MKILLVTNMYPTTDAPAAGLFVYDHVRALERRGLAVDVVAVHGRQSRTQYATALPALARRLRQGAFDLVHAQHTYSAMQVALAATLTRRRHRMLLTMHEGESFLPEGIRDPGADRIRQLVYSKRIKRWAAGLADHVVTVAPGLLETLSLHIPHTVIPPGVDVDRFRPLERDACRETLGLPRAASIVFFPASPRRDFNKGYSEFMEAVSLLDFPVHAVTAGEIHPREMPLYMNAADVVVQASRFEGSPMVVKEAMACDRPLVSTDVGDVRELCAGVRGCFICSRDPEDMAEKIAEATRFDGREPGGRARILERELTVQAVAERYIAVYQQIADSSR